MNNWSEQDIEKIVAGVLAGCGREKAGGEPILVEVSARHVHLTQAALETLFGPGYALHNKRSLSQPGEFLSDERVKLVTGKGEIANVSVLGPVRKAVQVELSATDCRQLGIQAPVNLSGDLTGAGDVLLLGPAGYLMAKGAVIIAKAHIHMTPDDAAHYGVKDGEVVSVKLSSPRPVTLDDVPIRVKPNFFLAMHIDFDEANASMADKNTTGQILR
jgi:putative phosphotransacetylase